MGGSAATGASICAEQHRATESTKTTSRHKEGEYMSEAWSAGILIFKINYFIYFCVLFCVILNLHIIYSPSAGKERVRSVP